MSSTDDSAWKDAVKPKVISGPVPSTVNTITNNSGAWQPGMTLFNYEEYQKRNLLDSGMVPAPENKNTSNYSSSNDQTSDTTTLMKQQLQQGAENAKNDSLATDNDSTVTKVDAFSNIENVDTSFVFPYNTFVNALVCMILIYLLMKMNTFHGLFLLIGSLHRPKRKMRQKPVKKIR